MHLDIQLDVPCPQRRQRVVVERVVGLLGAAVLKARADERAAALEDARRERRSRGFLKTLTTAGAIVLALLAL